ncbi:MAG TPA: hypothetical protein VG322_03815, partial [Candidatus Acidoferrales bacterium]|nr:hypothetical protein [Candidatus Acidoferrales bacterium]
MSRNSILFSIDFRAKSKKSQPLRMAAQLQTATANSNCKQQLQTATANSNCKQQLQTATAN